MLNYYKLLDLKKVDKSLIISENSFLILSFQPYQNNYPFIDYKSGKEIYCENFGIKKNNKIIEDVYNWMKIYDLIYKLWIDSGIYEKWAGKQLKNINSELNQKGLIIVKTLNQYVSTYYYLISTNNLKNKICPLCKNKFDTFDFTINICHNCKIITGYKWH